MTGLVCRVASDRLAHAHTGARQLRRARPSPALQLTAAAVLCAFALGACNPQDQVQTAPERPVRGLIAQQMVPISGAQIRRYPGVIEPSELTSLSFEVAGQVGRLDLTVGQVVEEGQLLAFLDDAEFLNTIDDRRAAVDEAQALLEQAADTLSRQEQLFERRVVSRVAVDDARTDVRSRQAQLTQAEKALATAQEDLNDTKLYAPFNGIINAVEADSFTTVGVGTTVLSVYESGSYEVSFSVNFDVVSRLVVGTPATIRLADDPSVVLDGVVSELGERADTVSSFPVIVQIAGEHPILRAGMAVEVSFEFNVEAGGGFLVPVSAGGTDHTIADDAAAGQPIDIPLYVFDPDTSTVEYRMAVTDGIHENQLLIIEGLEEGEWVAVKGVSFLRDGMEVRLIEDWD